MNITFSARPKPQFGVLTPEEKLRKRNETLEFCVEVLPDVFDTLRSEVKLNHSGSSNSAAIAAGHVLQTLGTLLASDLDLYLAKRPD